MPSSPRLKANFLSKIGRSQPFMELFDHLGDVYFFMKDQRGHFVAANPLQVEKLGCGSEADVIGKTDHDFFPRHLVAAYREDDRRVMATGRPIIKKVEVVANPDGTMEWHITSKLPVWDRAGRVIGITGFMRKLDRDAHSWLPYQEMSRVVDYIRANYAAPLMVATLARVVGLSVSQFERRFQQVFHMTPTRFLTRFRVTRACDFLIKTNGTITQIALDVGFFDHSHFSRSFKSILGLSPGEYRRAHTS
jgi:PAS domain S-box-containing protein